MPRKRNQTNNQIDKNEIIQIRRDEIARKTKQGIVLLLLFLSIPCAFLIFKIGESFYSAWLIENRAQSIGILLFAITIVSVSLPLIIEVNSNPRPLSGPGKNPKMDPWGYIDSNDRK